MNRLKLAKTGVGFLALFCLLIEYVTVKGIDHLFHHYVTILSKNMFLLITGLLFALTIFTAFIFVLSLEFILQKRETINKRYI